MADERILIVEDDHGAREALAELLRGDGYAVIEAADIAQARASLGGEGIDAMLLDLKMPDGDGQALLDELAIRKALPPTIVMTAFGSGSRAIEAMRAGADDYLQKPIDFDALLASLRTAIARKKVHRDVLSYRPSDARATSEPIVGSSHAMQAVFKRIGRVAQSDATVLIVGESGTGKELVARAIHTYSARASGPFVAVNCAAVPEPLLEAELFGFEKGAFTSAVAQRIGRFEAAAGGTLFLDEVVDISTAMQAKLLRACKSARSSGSAVTRRSASIRASWRRRTDIRSGKLPPGGFARISSTASASSKSRYRRCANVATTSRCSSRRSCTERPHGMDARCRSRRKPSTFCVTDRGPATYANWKTRSSAASCFLAARSTRNTCESTRPRLTRCRRATALTMRPNLSDRGGCQRARFLRDERQDDRDEQHDRHRHQRARERSSLVFHGPGDVGTDQSAYSPGRDDVTVILTEIARAEIVGVKRRHRAESAAVARQNDRKCEQHERYAMKARQQEEDDDLGAVDERIGRVPAEAIRNGAPEKAAEPIAHRDDGVSADCRSGERLDGVRGADAFRNQLANDRHGVGDDQDSRDDVEEQHQPKQIQLRRAKHLSGCIGTLVGNARRGCSGDRVPFGRRMRRAQSPSRPFRLRARVCQETTWLPLQPALYTPSRCRSRR